MNANKQVMIRGGIDMVKTPDGENAIVITVSPFEEYIIPIPSTAPSPDVPSAKDVVISGLSGVVVATHMPPNQNHGAG